MTTTYTTISDLLDSIEDDEVFAAFCQESFGCKITRGQITKLSKRSMIDRLTWLFTEPEEWNNQAFNEPVHVYVWMPDQETDEDHAYKVPTDCVLNIVVRFRAGTTLQNLYDFTDQFRLALRRHDATVRPLWNNQSVNFETIGTAPAVRMQAAITAELCTEDFE